jgi:hypothetical protein
VTISEAVRQFADVYPGCAAHAREASAVLVAIEGLVHRLPADLGPDMSVCDALGGAGSEPRPESLFDDVQKMRDLLVVAEKNAAGQWPFGSVEETFREVFAHRVMETLLGAATSETTWAPHTVWARSLRGLVNERVRRLGTCSCPDAEERGGFSRRTTTR